MMMNIQHQTLAKCIAAKSVCMHDFSIHKSSLACKIDNRHAKLPIDFKYL